MHNIVSKKIVNKGIKASNRLAHKLSGHNRVVALRSINQLRAYAKNNSFSNLPALVIGQL